MTLAKLGWDQILEWNLQYRFFSGNMSVHRFIKNVGAVGRHRLHALEFDLSQKLLVASHRRVIIVTRQNTTKTVADEGLHMAQKRSQKLQSQTYMLFGCPVVLGSFLQHVENHILLNVEGRAGCMVRGYRSVAFDALD